MRTHRSHKVLFAVALIAAFAVGGVKTMVQQRLAAQFLREDAVSEPGLPVDLAKDGETTGRISADVAYTSMAAGSEGKVHTTVNWDDDWFFADPTEYNHELATTCSVLSAIANSESAYYQAGSDSPAYMEACLVALGFENVSTASYQYRSEISDEVTSLFSDQMDVTAYSIASKRITDSQTGAKKTLFLVSIRGSYGTEWLSDANLGSAAELEMDSMDHEGFSEPAEEIVEQLEERITAFCEDGGTTDEVAILFCGHSRGAATANIAAADADARTLSLSPLANLDSIYAYTFACPRSTTSAAASDADGAIYANIFNILNPSDMVPRLPLASWGYTRYGTDLWLPEEGTDVFDEKYDAMRAAWLANTSVESVYVPSDVYVVDDFESALEDEIAGQEDFYTPGGMLTVVRHVLFDMNVAQVLCSHYPNTYIAWMQAIDASDLRTSR